MIEEDDPLVEVQTDKTTVEIPSPAGGKVARILVAEGELVPGRHAARRHRRGRGSGGDRRRPGRFLRHRAGAVLDRALRAGQGDAARAQDRRRARRRPRAPRRHRAGRADHRGGRPALRDLLRWSDPGPGPERRVPLRGVRRQIAQHLDRLTPRGAGGHGRRGVRLHGARGRARRALLPPVPPAGGRRRPPRGTRAERDARRRGDRLLGALRPRPGGADGRGPGRARSCARPTRSRSTSSRPRRGGSPRPPAPGRSSPRSCGARPSR